MVNSAVANDIPDFIETSQGAPLDPEPNVAQCGRESTSGSTLKFMRIRNTDQQKISFLLPDKMNKQICSHKY